MKTDHPVYRFLAAGPEVFRVLTGGLALVGSHDFRSLMLKASERRIDGVLNPMATMGLCIFPNFKGK